MRKFDYHTPESFNAYCDELKAIADTSTNAALLKRQQEVGITFAHDGVLWDIQVRSMLQPPLCMFPDYMHVYVASGGLAQYELNGIILYFERKFAPLTAADIDEWCAQVQLPRGATRLGPKCF